jgi:hypothetical protein
MHADAAMFEWVIYTSSWLYGLVSVMQSRLGPGGCMCFCSPHQDAHVNNQYTQPQRATWPKILVELETEASFSVTVNEAVCLFHFSLQRSPRWKVNQ